MDDHPSAFDDEDALDLLVSGAEALDRRDAGPCPEANALAALADGAIAADARAEIEVHLSRCPPCRTIAAALSAIVAVGAGAVDVDGSTSRPVGGGVEPEPRFPRAFGPYTLLRRIGAGGMGEVFEAEHRGRGRREALKQLRAGLDDDPRAAERFLREVRAVAGVVHDHVVPLYDSGTIDGVLYFTMPLLAGPSFAEIAAEIRAADADPARAGNAVFDRHGIAAADASADADESFARRVAALGAGVADALSAMHAAGMIHRDVKPSNVVLDERRRAVLTDFGLVRVDASLITRASETLGTPAYMAPEQLVPGAIVDGRADVYGLGATLYELVTLHRPYEGKTLAETVALILRGSPRPPRERNPRLPRDLDVILGRCLERRPADRYADAHALALDLAAFSRGDPIAARPVSAFGRLRRALARRKLSVGVAACVLAMLGTAVYLVPGHVSIRALPAASVLLDGEDVGTTPLRERTVAAGGHRIELRHERFAPTVRTFDLGRRQTYDLDVVLRALDPADPETLKMLESERGVERVDVEVAVDRSPSPTAELAVLLPRGAMREAPTEVSIWAEAPVQGVTVRLERVDARGAAETVHSWDVPTAFRQSRLAVPDDVRARLVAGAYRLSIAGGGKSGALAAFEILSAADAKRIGDAVDAQGRGFEKGDAAAGFLRAESLVGHGLYMETLAETARLRQSVGDRKEVARLTLAALDRAGLRDVGPWFEWAETYLRAEK